MPGWLLWALACVLWWSCGVCAGVFRNSVGAMSKGGGMSRIDKVKLGYTLAENLGA